MKLTVFALPGVPLQVEAEVTENPELAIFPMKVADLPNLVSGATSVARASAATPVKGMVWAIGHIPTGTIVLYGMLTRDLAIETSRMLTASGYEFGQGKRPEFELDAFQAAVAMMTDLYFQIFYTAVGGRELAHA